MAHRLTQSPNKQTSEEAIEECCSFFRLTIHPIGVLYSSSTPEYWSSRYESIIFGLETVETASSARNTYHPANLLFSFSTKVMCLIRPSSKNAIQTPDPCGQQTTQGITPAGKATTARRIVVLCSTNRLKSSPVPGETAHHRKVASIGTNLHTNRS